LLGRLTGKHLKSHGLSAAEYRDQFPGCKTSDTLSVSKETRAKMSASRSGKRHSDESKAKIGAKHKGKKRTPEDIDKWRASYAQYLEENGSPMLGKDRGDAFKKRMSEVAKARSPEMVQAKVEQMWAARRGSKATSEQRERYSQARLKYMQENPEKLGMKLFNTVPELEFEKILVSKEILYKKSVHIGGKLYDFLINENVIIEIDGPYHWNKNLYGSKSDPEEIKVEGLDRTKLRDKIKTDIANAIGYKLYRIRVNQHIPDNWVEQLLEQGCKLF
jgi:very-short-patch-repair endonuclease